MVFKFLTLINIPLFSKHLDGRAFSAPEMHSVLSSKKTFLRENFRNRDDFNSYVYRCYNCVQNCDYSVVYITKLVAVLMAVLSTLQTTFIQGDLKQAANTLNYVMTALSVSILLTNAVSGTVIREIYQTAHDRSQSEFDGPFWEIPNIENDIWGDRSEQTQTSQKFVGSSNGAASVSESGDGVSAASGFAGGAVGDRSVNLIALGSTPVNNSSSSSSGLSDVTAIGGLSTDSAVSPKDTSTTSSSAAALRTWRRSSSVLFVDSLCLAD